MSVSTLIQKLEEHQKILNNGRGLMTIANIIRSLKLGHIDLAKNEWMVDGDKICLEDQVCLDIEEELGCRIHNVINCQQWLCKSIRERRKAK